MLFLIAARDRVKPQLIPNKIVICKGENGGIYSRITDKGPKKGKDQLTVKVHWTSDYLYVRAKNIPGTT